MHRNEQTSLILPMYRDEKGNKLFELEIKSVMGQKAYDINAIIGRYKKELITTLMAGQLVLGQEGGGSYSLAESLQGVTEMVIRSRLQEIADQLNHDLIPQLFKLNGFDVRITPKFKFGEIQRESLDELGKYVQRVGAIGLMPKTPEIVNRVVERAGFKPQFNTDETDENFLPKLTGYTSGAGEGMEQGTGNGTGKTVAARDNTVSNKENA